ncbi:MAG: DUF4974 domain-containing protein [Odoribacter sp.]
MIVPEHIAQLIFLHLQGNANEMQQQELAEWRKISLRNEELYQKMILRQHWEKHLELCVKKEAAVEQEWQQLSDRMDRADRKSLKKWFAYAAMIAFVLTVGGVTLFYADRMMADKNELLAAGDWKQPFHPILTLPDGTQVDLKDDLSCTALSGRETTVQIEEGALTYREAAAADEEEIYHTLTIPRGGEYVLTLADGSTVYLNAASSLTYPVNFKGKKRKVYLEGEAYFKVAKNAEMPFIVDAKCLEVEVTGTAFGVRAYREEENIQTTLESGKVTVRAGGQTVNLEPDHQALFDKKTTALDVFAVNTNLYLAWKDGRLMFDNCPLEKILEELGRWYAFDVFYQNREVRSAQFSLNMEKHESFEEVLTLIENTGGVRFEIKNHTVIVK